jgi:prolipoprotein diacylglyceryltransferase
VSTPEGKSILAGPTDFKDTVTAHLGFYQRAFAGVNEVNGYEDVMHKTVKAPSWLPDWMVAYSYPHNVISEGIPNINCEGQWCNHLPVPVFPTPFYEAIVCIGLFGLLWAIRKRFKIPGVLFGVYLILNGLERFLVESIRVNTTYHIGNFHPTQAQLISSGLVLAGIGITLYKRRSHKTATEAANA